MPQTEPTPQPTEPTPSNGTNNGIEMYLEEIKKLKENTVSKEEYDQLIEQNKTLLKNIIDGQPMGNQSESEVDLDKHIGELRQKLFDPEQTLSNLEYAETALELRDAVLKKSNGAEDIFVANGIKHQVTEADYKSAEKVAAYLKNAIQYADGDSELFTQEVQRNMIDTGPQIEVRKKNQGRR